MAFYLPFLKLQQPLCVGGHYENVTHLPLCVGTSNPVLLYGCIDKHILYKDNRWIIGFYTFPLKVEERN